MLHKTKSYNTYEGEQDFDTGFEALPNKNTTSSWGEPFYRLLVKETKTCPRCGADRERGFQLIVNDDGWVDAYCDCGFSL